MIDDWFRNLNIRNKGKGDKNIDFCYKGLFCRYGDKIWRVCKCIEFDNV